MVRERLYILPDSFGLPVTSKAKPRFKPLIPPVAGYSGIITRILEIFFHSQYIINMKRLILFTALGLCMAGALSAQSLIGRTMYVTGKIIEVKSSTAFFSDILGTLSYGDPVSVLQQYGKWVQVRSMEPPVLNGWVAAASLTTKRILVSAGTTSASANEIALAGKGFNQEIEDVYRQNGTLNYDAIDAMEAIQIPTRQLFAFLQEGRLARGE